VVVYLKAHRTLHTLASPAVAEYFPGLRADLLRTAVRDAAFELVLRAVHPEEPHPELYRFLREFVAGLERAPTATVVPYSLWLFLARFAQHLGVGLDLERCVVCGRALPPAQDTVLSAEDGGFACGGCVPPARSEALVPAAVRAYLAGPGGDPPDGMDTADLRRITRLLSAWCRRHLDLSGDFPALDFVCELTDGSAGARH
jgi:DNA repair protein RecO (recombination protein O)